MIFLFEVSIANAAEVRARVVDPSTFVFFDIIVTPAPL